LSSYPRVVVPTDSQSADSWHQASAYAQAICSNAEPPIDRIILLTHTKQQLDQTALANHWGTNAAKALSAGKELPIRSGPKLRHATRQTLSYSAGNAVVIVFFADDKLLEFVDGLSGVAGVVAVPDFSGQTDDWIARWTPLIHGEPQKAEEVLIDDKVFENALKALSRWINLSHNVLHPRDEEHVKEYLRILRAKGHSGDPGKVKSWAIRNGWKPGAADRLADLAKKIGGMKTKPNLSGIHNAEGKYENWKKPDTE